MYRVRAVLLVLMLLAFIAPAQADMSHDKLMVHLTQLAKAGNTKQFIKIVKDNKIIDKKDKDGHSPLFASLMGSPNLAAKLLKMGAPLEQKDNNGSTPLIISAMMGYPEMVEALLQHGADIKTINQDGYSALTIAALGKSIAQPGAPSSSKVKPEERWYRVASALIKKGADVNHVDKKGGTALFYAVGADDEKLCQLLIKSGADVNYALHGEIPLILFARENASAAIVTLLEKAGAKM